MAGLQYNFFPTDFYYPRSQSVPADHTGGAAAVTFQTKQTQQKEISDELEWPKSLGFRVRQAAGSSKQAGGGVSMRVMGGGQNRVKPYVEGKLVKYSGESMVLHLVPEELSD